MEVAVRAPHLFDECQSQVKSSLIMRTGTHVLHVKEARTTSLGQFFEMQCRMTELGDAGDGELAEKSTASGRGHVCRAAFGGANAPPARARACIARLCGRPLDGTETYTPASDVLLPGQKASGVT